MSPSCILTPWRLAGVSGASGLVIGQRRPGSGELVITAYFVYIMLMIGSPACFQQPGSFRSLPPRRRLRVVAARGAQSVQSRARHIVGMLRQIGVELVCHGMTKDGIRSTSRPTRSSFRGAVCLEGDIPGEGHGVIVRRSGGTIGTLGGI